MASASMPDVLEEIRTVLRSLPGLNPNEYPSEQDENPIICLAYPGPGDSSLGTSHGGTGRPSYWQTDTFLIDITTARSDLASDLKAIEPYAQGVPSALMVGFSRDRFNGRVVVFGDPNTPGSTRPIRRRLVYMENGAPVYRFEVDVSYQVEILHD